MRTHTAKSATQHDNQRRAPEVLHPGEKVDDFSVLRALGSGGCGTVYLATQLSLGRQIALKVAENSGQEARMLAQLEHPHIVQVHSETIDEQRNARLICMQYVPGTTLEGFLDFLRQTKGTTVNGSDVLKLAEMNAQTEVLLSPQGLKAREYVASLDPVELAAWFGWKLADALAYAHQHGVLHLDVKPANVLINPYGAPLLTDFSVSLTQSRFRGEVDAKAMIDSFGGTFEYMPPEQLKVFESDDIPNAVKILDGRCDVYALGRVVQNLLRHLTGQQVGRDRRYGTSALLAVVERSVKPNPKDRYQNAAEQAVAFESALEFYRMQRRLPAVHGLLEFAGRHSAISLVVFALIPQLLGSLVHNSYNTLQIVRHLNEAQSAAYAKLIFYYNLVGYIVCAGMIWFPQIITLQRRLNRLDRYVGAEGMAKLRRQVLSLPSWVVGITSFGWLPNALLYPLYLHLRVAPLSKTLFAHFVLSCVFSWIVALAYSFLYVQFICLRWLYPRLWLGCTQISDTARRELAGYRRRLRVFSLLIALVPLLGASFIVFSGPECFQTEQYWMFRLLVVCLILIGMAGVVFGGSRIQEMSDTLRTLITDESSGS